MLDEYLWGHIERISPEAPVPILNVIRRTSTLGGAGNVVENLRTLGVDVTVLGVVGSDETGIEICNLLQTHGAEMSGVVVDPLRKSTRKARLMSLEHGQQVFRLDEESTATVENSIEERVIEKIRTLSGDIKAIVCSDYRKGFLSEGILAAAFGASRDRGILSIAAPKEANPQRYYGASILMPNARELSQLCGTPEGTVPLFDSAQRLVAMLNLAALVVTRGRDGISLFEKMGGHLRKTDIPTMARSVYDVTGAGDTALATFAAAAGSGCDLEGAAYLANVAAGIKVGKRGTACVEIDEIRSLLEKNPALG